MARNEYVRAEWLPYDPELTSLNLQIKISKQFRQKKDETKDM